MPLIGLVLVASTLHLMLHPLLQFLHFCRNVQIAPNLLLLLTLWLGADVAIGPLSHHFLKRCCDRCCWFWFHYQSPSSPQVLFVSAVFASLSSCCYLACCPIDALQPVLSLLVFILDYQLTCPLLQAFAEAFYNCSNSLTTPWHNQVVC